MAVGQSVLTGSWDVPAVLAVEDRLARRAADAGRVHAGLLRDVLELHTHHVAAGLGLSTPAQVALLLRCSEWRAGRLLNEAIGLADLPQAVEALEWGLLQPEQCSTVVTQLAPLSPPQRLGLWQRLLARLGRDAERGAVLPPARLGELLRTWVLEVAPQDVVEQREQAQQDGRVDYRKREDGLVDLFLIGIAPPTAQAVLHRIRVGAEPVGLWDDRPADRRRLDSAVDLILGRDVLGGGRCASACGCRPGETAPCGTLVQVLVPIGAALGTTDEVAQLAGHGPIEADLLQALLRNRPVLQPVFVDGKGVPVGIARRQPRPERDPRDVRQALLHLAGLRPERLFPTHADGHPRQDEALDGGPPPAGRPRLPRPEPASPGSGAHPPDTPGPYRVTGLLRALVLARSPRCEFPGCGARAALCDVEHDVAWPLGPSCSCQIGPCCRRHHRVKQLGWSKTRRPDASVTWTGQTGRTWLSPAQHQPPAPAVRPLPPIPTPNPFDELSPADLEHELWLLDDRPEDGSAYELRAHDREPVDDEDLAAQRIQHADTRWTLDLDDPYPWMPEPLLVG